MVVSQGVGRFSVRDVKRTLPHDVVDASWVLDREEGDHEAWRAFEFGPGGVKLSSTSAEVAELAPLRLDRAPVQSGIVVEEMAEPVDDDTASDDVEQRVWDAVAVDGGLLEKILIADGTPEEQAKIRLPPSPDPAEARGRAGRRGPRRGGGSGSRSPCPRRWGSSTSRRGARAAGGRVDGGPAPPGRARADAAGRAPPGASCRRSSRNGGRTECF